MDQVAQTKVDTADVITKRFFGEDPAVKDDQYLISIKSREGDPGCGPLAPGPDEDTALYNLWEPIDGWFCEDFLYAGWRQCKFLV